MNAKFHEQEAKIIAEAGFPGAVTIATNMAGRGTDIKLGGNVEMRVEEETAEIEDPKLLKKRIKEITAEVEKNAAIAKEAGGLLVIGTERNRAPSWYFSDEKEG